MTESQVAAQYFSPVVGEPEALKFNLRQLPMKLIREEIETVQVLTEEKDGTKSFLHSRSFLQGDIKNRNGRIYESRSC